MQKNQKLSLSLTEVVKNGYNQAASRYAAERNLLRSDKYIYKLLQVLPPHSQILDLGCGNGVPVTELLLKKKHLVIGIDISQTQIALAKKNCPGGDFKVQDIATLKKEEYAVDAVVSFYALFHLPRNSHAEVLETIASFIRKNGYLLLTMGNKNWEGYHPFYGVQMWSSHFGPQQNRTIVEKAGFRILLDELDKSGKEEHQIIFAQKR